MHKYHFTKYELKLSIPRCGRDGVKLCTNKIEETTCLQCIKGFKKDQEYDEKYPEPTSLELALFDDIFEFKKGVAFVGGLFEINNKKIWIVNRDGNLVADYTWPTSKSLSLESFFSRIGIRRFINSLAKSIMDYKNKFKQPYNKCMQADLQQKAAASG
ncbi:MAG: hypothetical protein ABH952_08550 [Candidatus Omnitrophota bacterium]